MSFNGVVYVLYCLLPLAISDGLEGLEALSSLSEMADTLGKIFTGEGCTFECPSGETPVPKPGHKPSSNGCGSFGIKIEVLPQMKSCCDKHDYCYDTCGSDKAECDKDFKKCLTFMCDKMKNSLKKNEYSECEFIDKLFLDVVNTELGCLAFKRANGNACDCNNNTTDTVVNNDKQSALLDTVLNAIAPEPKKDTYLIEKLPVDYEKQLDDYANAHKKQLN